MAAAVKKRKGAPVGPPLFTVEFLRPWRGYQGPRKTREGDDVTGERAGFPKRMIEGLTKKRKGGAFAKRCHSDEEALAIHEKRVAAMSKHDNRSKLDKILDIVERQDKRIAELEKAKGK